MVTFVTSNTESSNKIHTNLHCSHCFRLLFLVVQFFFQITNFPFLSFIFLLSPLDLEMRTSILDPDELSAFSLQESASSSSFSFKFSKIFMHIFTLPVPSSQSFCFFDLLSLLSWTFFSSMMIRFLLLAEAAMSKRFL